MYNRARLTPSPSVLGRALQERDPMRKRASAPQLSFSETLLENMCWGGAVDTLAPTISPSTRPRRWEEGAVGKNQSGGGGVASAAHPPRAMRCSRSGDRARR